MKQKRNETDTVHNTS